MWRIGKNVCRPGLTSFWISQPSLTKSRNCSSGLSGVQDLARACEEPAGRARLYYQITLPNSTVWIPVEAQAAIGLRLVTARSDLDQYRVLLKSRPVPLHKDHKQRHLELVTRLNQGSFQVVCEVVRDLTAWGWRKSLNRTDLESVQLVGIYTYLLRRYGPFVPNKREQHPNAGE